MPPLALERFQPPLLRTYRVDFLRFFRGWSSCEDPLAEEEEEAAGGEPSSSSEEKSCFSMIVWRSDSNLTVLASSIVSASSDSSCTVSQKSTGHYISFLPELHPNFFHIRSSTHDAEMIRALSSHTKVFLFLKNPIRASATRRENSPSETLKPARLTALQATSERQKASSDRSKPTQHTVAGRR